MENGTYKGKDIREISMKYLNTLVGQTLNYGLKSPDTELYDFGFGEWFVATKRNGRKASVCIHNLHVLCPFKIVSRNSSRIVENFSANTDPAKFAETIKCLIGLQIKRVTLGSQNDLWLDLGDFWIVFLTWNDNEESWRYFHYNDDAPHLVASALRLRIDD